MARINNTSKYPVKIELDGREILTGSDFPTTGETLNVSVDILKDYIAANIDVADYNGTVGINDSLGDFTSGYWIANEKGIYVNFGNVENIWDTAIITLTNGVFTIKEFLNTEKLQYDDDFDI